MKKITQEYEKSDKNFKNNHCGSGKVASCILVVWKIFFKKLVYYSEKMWDAQKWN